MYSYILAGGAEDREEASDDPGTPGGQKLRLYNFTPR